MPIPPFLRSTGLRTLLAGFVVATVGGAVIMTITDHLQAFTTETARRIAVRAHPVPIPAVGLETQTSAQVNLADFRGKWLLVDFIYTRCPSFCVVLGDEFAQLQDSLAAPLAQGKVQLLSVSFEPAYDTPSRLAAYLQRSGMRGAGWLAARPVTSQGLVTIEHAFGITVVPDGLGGYVHNAAVHVIDPRGRLVEIMDLGDPSRVTRTIMRDLGK